MTTRVRPATPPKATCHSPSAASGRALHMRTVNTRQTTNPSLGADFEIHTREILDSRARLNAILAKHTGQSIEKIATDTDRDNFMSAPAAKAYGIIDHVLEARAELPVAKSTP